MQLKLFIRVPMMYVGSPATDDVETVIGSLIGRVIRMAANSSISI